MKEEIGRRVRDARDKKGISQEKLAELVDLSLSSISRLETGRTMVSVEKLLRIADALNVGIDELLADFIQGAKPEERLMNRVSVLLALCSKEDVKRQK